MRRWLLPALLLTVAMVLPAAAVAAPAPVLKIKTGNLKGGKARILSTVPVFGTLRPFAPRQKVLVTFFRNGKPVKRARVAVRRGKGGAGVFRARIRIRAAGKYAVSTRHAANAALGGARTKRKSWRVSFPALRRGQCGPLVVAFKRGLRKLGYIANRGRCLKGKTARGVLAYRKVNGMAQTMHAGAALVKRVFAGRGAAPLRHPGAGRHVEVPLAKQVLVFAKGGKPRAVYPISSGKASTPTVKGRYEFFRTEPGYNNKRMYYSWYFYRGYAIHGFASVPDYPASHGCIRTFIADQPEVYERIRYGESIFVY